MDTRAGGGIGANCGGSYVGETGNFQHAYDVRKVSSNALAEHAEATGHEMDRDKANITERENNWTSRIYIESLTI